MHNINGRPLLNIAGQKENMCRELFEKIQVGTELLVYAHWNLLTNE